MQIIVIKQAQETEIDWINQQYKAINFVESDFKNEYIIVAYYDGKQAGLGRLVKIDHQNIELGGIYVFPQFRGLKIAENIVSHLCLNNPFGESNVWCLPFENLSGFYQKFGFKPFEIPNTAIPEKVSKKLQWCNSENRYEQKVILLYKRF
jgi:N-acetylglutamate synthase-like GNAT family acetyltransferase